MLSHNFETDFPDLFFSSLRLVPLQVKANAVQKPTFSWWLHALFPGVISPAV